MDKDTTIDELKNQVKIFCDELEWGKFHNPKDLAIGLVTESSELLEIFRFRSQEEIDAMFKDAKKREEISHEVSDALYMILRFAQLNNIDLSEELKKKLDHNRKKYPVSKFKGTNSKYTEL